MRIEVFKITEDNWGVRLSKELEITGFQNAPSAHVWILQWLIQLTGKKLSEEAMKETLKAGQAEVNRILKEAAKDNDDQPAESP